ncbi:hypothetical protein [Streptomyces sp. DH10]|uniref:hypothetical protein n=1 Tax=Streptomyces sp. DH10 TaxID=3040121 RepID=UPI002442DB40|nr:hypothetical protein [Streptomyces sp. DH10]MDG9710703.1 hypothetical protein [Streptomyces sp. DH10]
MTGTAGTLPQARSSRTSTPHHHCSTRSGDHPLLGLTGWLMWVVWLVVYGVALMRRAPQSPTGR